MLFLSPTRTLAFAFLASIFFFTADAHSTTDAAAVLASLPECGLQCIMENLPAIGCGLTDVECQCNSKNSTHILQPCLQEQCTFDQTFEILRVQAALCDRPHDSYGNAIKALAWVTGIIPIIVIIMRFTSRHLGGNNFWWDDWVHLVAAILVIPMTVALLLNVEAGLGSHVWDLSYSNIVAVGRWTYIATLFWGFELLLLKYSILCLYLRIFPNVWLKRAIFVFMAFTACFTLPLIGLAAFQCIPISAIWDLEERGNARCIDWIVVLRLTVVYEIFAEVVLFGLPIPVVWKLQMKTTKKIQLMIFFGLGICVIATSTVRVPFLPGVTETVDPTYDVTRTTITGFTTSGVAHICAAVPALKTLFRFCFNGFKHRTKVSSSGYSKDNKSATSGRRSYNALKDRKNSSSLSGKTLEASQQRSQNSSRTGVEGDPYRISTLLDDDKDDGFVELRPIQTPRTETPPPAIIRGTAFRDSEIDDSASNKAILL